jgi:hypothetical protein
VTFAPGVSAPPTRSFSSPVAGGASCAVAIQHQQRRHQPRQSRSTARQRAKAMVTLFPQTPSGTARYQPPKTPAAILCYTTTMGRLVPRGIRYFSRPRASIGARLASLTGNMDPSRTVGKVTYLQWPFLTPPSRVRSGRTVLGPFGASQAPGPTVNQSYRRSRPLPRGDDRVTPCKACLNLAYLSPHGHIVPKS